MKKPQKNHDRAVGETQITISLPQWLRDELTALAAQDERSRSQWIVRELKALLARKKVEEIKRIKHPPTPLAVSSSPTLRERLKKTKLTSH
jgi:hypothetical protein